MHAIPDINPSELIERREQILRTVEYLRDERLGLEQNAPWMDAVAYRRRISLLESLTVWYDEERRRSIRRSVENVSPLLAKGKANLLVAAAEKKRCYYAVGWRILSKNFSTLLTRSSTGSAVLSSRRAAEGISSIGS